jgi:3-oxoacyl-[acyl-carrier protein] reductase
MNKLIVGCGQWNWQATVEKAIQAGYFVIAADKDAEGLRALNSRYGVDVLETHVADFSDNAVIKALMVI